MNQEAVYSLFVRTKEGKEFFLDLRVSEAKAREIAKNPNYDLILGYPNFRSARTEDGIKIFKQT